MDNTACLDLAALFPAAIPLSFYFQLPSPLLLQIYLQIAFVQTQAVISAEQIIDIPLHAFLL